jgi:pimeloyl-ACP methyl ester carboxylesterase
MVDRKKASIDRYFNELSNTFIGYFLISRSITSIHMNHPKIQTLWLSANPHFQRFAKPLNSYLAERISIAEWQYYQSQDEPCSLEIALILLHDYLKYLNRPIHLIGHSTGGALGLLYARKYPERVKSLTILGVGVNPAIDWQARQRNDSRSNG